MIKRLTDAALTFMVVFLFANGSCILVFPLVIKDLHHAFMISVITSATISFVLTFVDQVRYFMKNARTLYSNPEILDDVMVEQQEKEEEHENV